MLLVVSRTPLREPVAPGRQFSTSRWCCTWTCRCWCGLYPWRAAVEPAWQPACPGAGWVALWVTAAGTLAMALAPFWRPANHHGQTISRCWNRRCSCRAGGVWRGAALLVLRSLWAAPRWACSTTGGRAALRPQRGAAVATAVALLCFAWSWAVLPTTWTARRITKSCSGVAGMRCSSPGRCLCSWPGSGWQAPAAPVVLSPAWRC